MKMAAVEQWKIELAVEPDRNVSAQGPMSSPESLTQLPIVPLVVLSNPYVPSSCRYRAAEVGQHCEALLALHELTYVLPGI